MITSDAGLTVEDEAVRAFVGEIVADGVGLFKALAKRRKQELLDIVEDSGHGSVPGVRCVPSCHSLAGSSNGRGAGVQPVFILTALS
ncbi:MAG: hypothetical protein R3202_10255 [Candidatus Competibacterales bacterium]|nr:hypothetical protein [Candidatus Competibacterales bacterium]